jgi:hypothetical protein
VWRRHFYDGMQAALPSVVLPVGVDFEWARPAAYAPRGPSADREATSQRLWDQIRGAQAAGGLDAVISYCFGADIDPGLVERTIEMGVPWINFYCDSSYAFDLVETIARVASLNWFPERAAIESYRALGRPLLCRPYAVHPDALPDASCQAAQYRLGFLGAPNGNRVLHMARLLLLGCPTAVRGVGWQPTPGTAPPRPRQPPAQTDRRMRGSFVERVLARAVAPVVRRGGRPLTDEDVVRFLSRCRVVLGLNEGRDLQGRYRSYLKLRDVEFPGYGCCYLTQHNEDVENAFEVGSEVLTFRSSMEAASIVRRSVRHPTEARAIGQAGRRRVMAEHTWAARLRELAQAL